MATGSVRSADAGRSWQPLEVGWPAGYGTTRARALCATPWD